MQETRTFTAQGITYTYIFARKAIKNFNLRVKKDGTLYVSAPRHMPLSRVEEFLSHQTEFIKRARERLAARAAAAPQPLHLVTGEALPIWGVLHTVCVLKHTKRLALTQEGMLYLYVKDPESATERYRCFTEFLDNEAREVLTARTAALTPLFAPKPPQAPALTFRTMTSKWGVCRPRTGRVTLNRNLVYLPLSLVDYVICHELAHFHHANHSAAFWQCLAARVPDCKERRRALNTTLLPRFAVLEDQSDGKKQ